MFSFSYYISLFKHLLFFGCVLFLSNKAISDEVTGQEAQPLASAQDQLIVVEPQSLEVLDQANASSYKLINYETRRGRWGFQANVAGGYWQLSNYEPNFAGSTDFEDTYEIDGGFLIELQTSLRRNLSWGAWSIDVAVGTYNNDSFDNTSTELKLMPIRGGLSVYLDRIWEEPYFVPYVNGGIYTIHFEETQTNTLFGGTTAAAFYFGGGALIQLNWLDPKGSVEAFAEAGLVNSYLLAEVKYFSSSTENIDPKFDSLIASAGLGFEF